MSPATPCFPLPQRDTKHGADVPGRSSCSIAARSCCRVCSPAETRGIWGSPPAYLEIGSVLLHVLLHTQAELLNPLPLGLHSSAVGLGNTQRAVSDERFPAGGSEEGQRCRGRMDIDGQDLAAARIVWTQTQSRRRQNRNRHTPGLLQTQVCLLPASKPQAGCSGVPAAPCFTTTKMGNGATPRSCSHSLQPHAAGGAQALHKLISAGRVWEQLYISHCVPGLKQLCHGSAITKCHQLSAPVRAPGAGQQLRASPRLCQVGSPPAPPLPAHLYGLLGGVVLQGQQLGCVLQGPQDVLLLFQLHRQLLCEGHEQRPNLGYQKLPVLRARGQLIKQAVTEHCSKHQQISAADRKPARLVRAAQPFPIRMPPAPNTRGRPNTDAGNLPRDLSSSKHYHCGKTAIYLYCFKEESIFLFSPDFFFAT